ncbi:mobilization protein [Embleya sp. NBC_00888]|uniref:relaxase/mobilization nuclease domain-containing protein n=1 Tax=Embleya sp. NBC_00888 TaxID=2975960 RepID=UPI003867796A|nr:mobilization protein [Embleya sp. NBC_00888]
MIVKIGKGTRTVGALHYVFGPGKKHSPHTDQHIVAAWEGFLPEPGHFDPDTPEHDAALTRLARLMDVRVDQAGADAPREHVWHCSLRNHPTDPILTDEQWAQAARRVVAAAGIAAAGDPNGCRWIAVRHADDHIHILATRVQADLRAPDTFRDVFRDGAECARMEEEWGLVRVDRPDRTAARRPTAPERHKAQRRGHTATVRETLREHVRTAVAASANESEFFGHLDRLGVKVKKRTLPSGDLAGYSVALPNDTNAKGGPVWFAGGTLAPDLSLPKIRARFPSGDHHDTPAAGPWYGAASAIDAVPGLLRRGYDEAGAGQLSALGETFSAMVVVTTGPTRLEVRRASIAFARATRSRVRADQRAGDALRSAARDLLWAGRSEQDGGATAMILCTLVLAALAAAHWHRLRNHHQQAAAAHQTLIHLQAAYRHTTTPRPTTTRATRPGTVPGARGEETPLATPEVMEALRKVLPEHADRILADPAWPALNTALTQATRTGKAPTTVLLDAAGQRELDTAASPTEVLTWRIRRQLHQPTPRARAATARSTRTTLTRPTTPAPSHRLPPTEEHHRRR